MNISVLGAGAYGSALGKVLEKNGHKVSFYDPYKFPEVSLKEALKGAEVILLAVPAERVREILGQIPVHKNKNEAVPGAEGADDICLLPYFPS